MPVAAKLGLRPQTVLPRRHFSPHEITQTLSMFSQLRPQRSTELRNRFLCFASVLLPAYTIQSHLKPLFNLFVAHGGKLIGIQAILYLRFGHSIADGLRAALGTTALAGAERIDLFPFQVHLFQEGEDDYCSGRDFLRVGGERAADPARGVPGELRSAAGGDRGRLGGVSGQTLLSMGR